MREAYSDFAISSDSVGGVQPTALLLFAYIGHYY